MTATRTEAPTTRPRVPMGSLLLLALACFTAVATETLPVGLLPLIHCSRLPQYKSMFSSFRYKFYRLAACHHTAF